MRPGSKRCQPSSRGNTTAEPGGDTARRPTAADSAWRLGYTGSATEKTALSVARVVIDNRGGLGRLPRMNGRRLRRRCRPNPNREVQGGLATVRTDDLAAHVVRRCSERQPALAERVDQVVFGSTNQAGEDNRNVARMALLLAGLPYEVPAVTVNRLVRVGSRSGQRRGTHDRARRGRGRHRRRCREHDARAVLDAEGRRGVPAHAAAHLRHDARLALREPPHEEALRAPSAWARRQRTSRRSTASPATNRTRSRSASHKKAAAAWEKNAFAAEIVRRRDSAEEGPGDDVRT